jgi:hypothetical protein
VESSTRDVQGFRRRDRGDGDDGDDARRVDEWADA